MNEVEGFIDELASFPTNGNFFNMYDYNYEFNEIRRNNLRLYFRQMQNLKPKSILVGEAPGFRGCRFTGIPFTSEYVLSNNIFFNNSDYKKENLKPRKEGTAKIMWEALDRLNQKPLLWNSFPFHPYKEGNFNSNRVPTKTEIELTLHLLKNIFDLFPTLDMVGAVGQNAQDVLKNRIKIQHICITHPSFGRKSQFIGDLNTFFENNQ